MTNASGKERDDHSWPTAVKWDLGVGGQHSDVVWRCDALRAGKLYNSSLFASEQEAEDFATKMRQHEPDQMFHVEKIMANTIWN
jgi:hypothetical protein